MNIGFVRLWSKIIFMFLYLKALHNKKTLFFYKTNYFRDGDSISNAFDNCVDLPNAEQANKDGDSFGECCFKTYDINYLLAFSK